MLSKILPTEIYQILEDKIDISNLYEIRMRMNQPICLSIKGKICFLGEKGMTTNIYNAITCSKKMLETIIFSACNCSVYAVNNYIKEGFIALDGGVRLGLVGEAVYSGNELQTINNINSINIRIPHLVRNCSGVAYDFLVDEIFHNTLIISSPGCGKTTFLRDLVMQIGNHNLALNSLVLDERLEIAGVRNGQPQFNLGCLVDIISGVRKKDGFECGIRSMSPNIIFTDEISNTQDLEAIDYALSCGISVVATTHAKNIDELKRKELFHSVVSRKLFDRFVVLSSRRGAGTIEGIYNEKFDLIYRE